MLLQLSLMAANNTTFPSEFNTVVLWFIRWALIILAIFYVMFGVMVVKQIRIMRQTLITSFSPILRLLGYAHLLLAILVLLVFLFVL